MQPLRNNNLSVYVSRCKQSSNQSQPIVILMLVRLNGKSVYRSFLSLCHTHAHSLALSPLRLVPMSSSTFIYSGPGILSDFSLFLQLSLSWPTLNDRQRTFNNTSFLLPDSDSSKCFLDNRTCPRDERGRRKQGHVGKRMDM